MFIYKLILLATLIYQVISSTSLLCWINGGTQECCTNNKKCTFNGGDGNDIIVYIDNELCTMTAHVDAPSYGNYAKSCMYCTNSDTNCTGYYSVNTPHCGLADIVTWQII